jgi:hypothetical protein
MNITAVRGSWPAIRGLCRETRAARRESRVSHGNDVVEPDLYRPLWRNEFHELGTVGAIDIGDCPGLSLGDALQIEFQLHQLLVHRRFFELVVVVAGNRLIPFFGHCFPRALPYTIGAERCGTILTRPLMTIASSLFRISTLAAAMPLAFALLLLAILIISFRSRAVVFCQYLQTMTGIKLRPSDVRRVYREGGADAVRTYFLDLIIREDLKQGPLEIPGRGQTEEPVAESVANE